ncbi:sulfatase family protein [Pontiella sulfatireligans]|uniref:Arylsulfatase n=1 Tax=Pontiella sulfatireligans TaxID=2750658 RepID=A0A6C2UE05_9BACT|nr:sulfatase [Pontiella sulfatireligans]SPS74129.1 sulfatase S1_25 [Kiritimatiellales bacterium]VGO18083.1 Arylsulfatase [Pontiella sulfatireligans]
MFRLKSLLLILAIGSGAMAAERPNIVFLFSDDQTIGAMGCYGNKEIITPNLDQLARDGVRFLNHYNTTSICMASRACVMTGLYEYRHGCNFGHGDLERRIFEASYTARLRKAGYFTGFVGKIGFEIQDEDFDVFDQEFDVFAGGPSQTSYNTAKNKRYARYAEQYPHASRACGAWGQDFIKTAKASGKPFCMSVSFKAPHMPFTPDPIDLKLYESVKIFKRPANFGVDNAAHLSPQSQTGRQAKIYRDWVNNYDETVRKYYALITGVDAAVGMIREGLEREGVAENTVIIFTSDNGYNSGSHGFGGKVLPYEEGSKSPLIIYDPRQPETQAGLVSEAVTANVDMAATIFALSGVAAPEELDGKDLLPLLSNPSARVRDALPLFNFWGPASCQSMAIVTPEWKYIHWYSEDKGMKTTDELFHLAKDRIEMKNVAGNPENADVLAKMQKAYDVELAAISSSFVPNHNYDAFGKVFGRSLLWDAKKDLVKAYSGRVQKDSSGKKPKKDK